MLWHCYHRQVAKEHPQSKYLSKLTSSLYSPQSGRRKGIQPLRDVKMKETKGCWCLLKKMVSVSWADQGVESEALTDAQDCFWQEAFFQVRSAWWSQLMNDRPVALALELHLAFMGWSYWSALPLTAPLPHPLQDCILPPLFSFQLHFIKYPHVYHTKDIETN